MGLSLMHEEFSKRKFVTIEKLKRGDFFEEEIPVFRNNFQKKVSLERIFRFVRATGKEHWEAWLLAQPEYSAWLLERGANVNAADGLALVLAARKGEFKVARKIIAEGASQDALDAALVEAAASGFASLVDLLLGKGADPRAKFGMAIQRAAVAGHEAIVRRLADEGANCLEEAKGCAISGGYPGIAWMLKENYGV